ncbi:MAG TPA: PhoH family protein [Spirochaetota bacterium]|jgi:phosphate starvation-inducible PhoH-like protein|nr:MAG: PhoH-like protein [Spirochaetes bacterium ADurb.Bin133]HOF01381.1 PhoH family protein [Spirochaetota bacterium]HOS33205.1 PhoH family protein [Spirochaetota bacterium]HOS56280.1 PhoH family protein [Spirochaetota bacterium]HPK61679.1 PhoH family protein [Spirochaetota bacterium]
MVKNQNLVIEDPKTLLNICGVNDKNLRRIEKLSGCSVHSVGNEICFEGENVFIVERTLQNLMRISETGGEIYTNLVELLYYEIEKNLDVDLNTVLTSNIEIHKVKKIFNPRSVNQGLYIQLLRERDIIFSYGPAGTGKTFIAIAFALSELLNKRYNKIILTRPVVEAGENLGFLPGDYIQKINPYLIPLFDSINSILTTEINVKLMSQNLIEIAPLAYMRGRTFNNSIVILDEAQNTTYTQMKMFLTRLGENSKLIIAGDITQVDLPKKIKSGMVEGLKIVSEISDIGIVNFQEKDVVRHPLVKKIINAYDKYERKE